MNKREKKKLLKELQKRTKKARKTLQKSFRSASKEGNLPKEIRNAMDALHGVMSALEAFLKLSKLRNGYDPDKDL